MSVLVSAASILNISPVFSGITKPYYVQIDQVNNLLILWLAQSPLNYPQVSSGGRYWSRKRERKEKSHSKDFTYRNVLLWVELSKGGILLLLLWGSVIVIVSLQSNICTFQYVNSVNFFANVLRPRWPSMHKLQKDYWHVWTGFKSLNSSGHYLYSHTTA